LIKKFIYEIGLGPEKKYNNCRDIGSRSPLPLYELGLKPEPRTETIRERVNVMKGVHVSRC